MKSDRRKGNEKRMVVIIFVIIFILVLTYKIFGSEIARYISHVREERISEEFFSEDGQNYTVGAYTFTMEKTLFDSESGIGYFVLSIKKGDGKPEIELNRWNQCVSNGIGENNRFYFDITVSNDITYWEKGKKLYAYISLHADCDEEVAITVVDREENEQYTFDLVDNVENQTYATASGAEIVLSPLGIHIVSDERVEEIEITLQREEGEELVVDTKNEIGTAGSSETDLYDGESEERKCEYTFLFSDVLKLSSIEGIVFNGEELR